MQREEEKKIQLKLTDALCSEIDVGRFFPFAAQRVGEDLQARVKGEFRALHQILHDQESCLLEQLRTEQQEELDKVQRHLEAVETAVRELEENMRVLQKAAATAESAVLTEVRRGGEDIRLRVHAGGV